MFADVTGRRRRLVTRTAGVFVVSLACWPLTLAASFHGSGFPPLSSPIRTRSLQGRHPVPRLEVPEDGTRRAVARPGVPD